LVCAVDVDKKEGASEFRGDGVYSSDELGVRRGSSTRLAGVGVVISSIGREGTSVAAGETAGETVADAVWLFDATKDVGLEGTWTHFSAVERPLCLE
jgi:hypothetical protein